ncbi:unnamed protein product [Linum trigynum]|uniref:Uncharacterized protein n=1 Tax=Linum trigynum TaxID=586398 RepID=A0AAV2FVM1_9ROSI
MDHYTRGLAIASLASNNPLCPETLSLPMTDPTATFENQGDGDSHTALIVGREIMRHFALGRITLATRELPSRSRPLKPRPTRLAAPTSLVLHTLPRHQAALVTPVDSSNSFISTIRRAWLSKHLSQ